MSETSEIEAGEAPESDAREKKRSVGRPPVDIASLRQEVRESLWTPNLRAVEGKSGLPDVFLPPPKAKKGTSAYKAWAMECFLELLRNGYNYTQAAEKLGYTYKWWENLRGRHPEFAKEAARIREEGPRAEEYPDLTQMPFEEFVRQYLGFELAEHQQWIADALQDPLGKLVLILGHPESGKSTLVSLWYVLYRIAQDPDIRIALVSKSSTKAQDLLTRVKRYLTEPHLYENSPRNLIEDFNGFRPAHGDLEWSQDQIFIRQRMSGERDPTVQALGIGKQIYGSRLDLLILDDSLVLDNQTSELQRERLDNWFTSEARSRAQKGQTVVNGTRLFPFDLYGQWKKSWATHRLFRLVSIPALLDEWTDQERVMWPDYWTLDGYDLTEEYNGEQVIVGHQPGMRDIRAEIMARDPNRWKLVYQQEDIEEMQNIFRQEHIDRAFDLGAGRPLGLVYDHEILILGVDPATTGRAAAVLLALDPISRVRTVVDIFVGSNLGASGIRQKLFYHFWEKYKPHGIASSVVEVNFAPTLLGDESFIFKAEAYGTRLVKHQTLARGKKRGSKWDEEYGVAAMAPLFSNGLVAFANAGPDDRTRLQPLVDDLITFPWADQQDSAIALWVANGEASVPVLAPISYQATMERRGVPQVVQQRVLAGRPQ